MRQQGRHVDFDQPNIPRADDFCASYLTARYGTSQNDPQKQISEIRPRRVSPHLRIVLRRASGTGSVREIRHNNGQLA